LGFNFIRQYHFGMVEHRQQSLIEQGAAAAGQNDRIPTQRAAGYPLVDNGMRGPF